MLGLALLVGCGERKIERIEWPVMGTVAAVQTRGATVEETAEVVPAAEAYPHIVLQAFLQRVINGGGQIIREMALGKRCYQEPVISLTLGRIARTLAKCRSVS